MTPGKSNKDREIQRGRALPLLLALASLAVACPALAQVGTVQGQTGEPVQLPAHSIGNFLRPRLPNEGTHSTGGRLLHYQYDGRPVIPWLLHTDKSLTRHTGTSPRLRTALASAAFPSPMRAQDAAAQGGKGEIDLVELAMQVENPLAALAKVPFYNNFQFGTGPENTFRYQLNIQPVFPVPISRDWKMISRTIALVISQNNIFADSGSQFGLGDTTQSFFFAPKKPTSDGFHWGVGPAFLLPTGTDAQLSSRKWGIGPTVSVVKQENGVFYGFLTHQIWSIAGDDRYKDTSQMFLQLTYSRTDKKVLTLGLNAEITANWKNGQWTVPLYFLATKVVQVGNQRMSLGGGVGWFIKHPDSTADWALRLIVTLLP